MKLLKIKAQSPGRILNIWNKAYTFDENAECLIPESEVVWLPPTYKITWVIENAPKIIPKEEVLVEEVKKVVVEEKEIEKVVEEKIDVKKETPKKKKKSKGVFGKRK